MTNTTPRIVVLERADLICNSGELEGEDLQDALEVREHRTRVHQTEMYLNELNGGPEDPEIVFWRDHTDA